MSDPSLTLLMPTYQRTLQSRPGTGFDQTETALQLERNSRAVIASINNRRYEAATSLVATTYRSDIDDLPKAESYDHNKEQFQQIMQKHPEYQIEVVDVSADIDEQSGYAIGKRSGRLEA